MRRTIHCHFILQEFWLCPVSHCPMELYAHMSGCGAALVYVLSLPSNVSFVILEENIRP